MAIFDPSIIDYPPRPAKLRIPHCWNQAHDKLGYFEVGDKTSVEYTGSHATLRVYKQHKDCYLYVIQGRAVTQLAGHHKELISCLIEGSEDFATDWHTRWGYRRCMESQEKVIQLLKDARK